MVRCIILCLLGISVYVVSTSNKDYGPYNLTLLNVHTCKGPKRRNCTESKSEIIGNRITFEVLVKENVKPTNGKIVGMTKNKDSITLQMKNPCKHFMLKSLLSTVMNATEDCVILKGYYKYTIDLNDILHKLYGGSFLYGNWTSRSMLYSDNCNFDCTVVKLRLSPQIAKIN